MEQLSQSNNHYEDLTSNPKENKSINYVELKFYK